MNEPEKSDSPVVSKKPANKAGLRSPAAELAEKRGLAEGNPDQQNSHQTQGRDRLQQALERIRQAVKGKREEKLTNLWHHVCEVDRLRKAYHESNHKGGTDVNAG